MKTPEPTDLYLRRLRSRWRRWLGQKRRVTGAAWTDLLNANFAGWPRRVLGEDLEGAADAWALAIDRASLADLQRLDIINLDWNDKRSR